MIDLKNEAIEAAQWRGHDLIWDSNSKTDHSEIGDCINAGCDAYVMIDTKPAANGIDIGGPAVALNCPARREIA